MPTADQLSLGWKNFALTNWELSIEAYYRKMKNLIRINNLENYLDAGIDYSKGTGDAYGMEFMVQYNKIVFLVGFHTLYLNQSANLKVKISF